MANKTIHLTYSDKKVALIDDLMQRSCLEKRTEFIKELIDIGMHVKEKYLNKNDDEIKPDYDALNLQASKNIIEFKKIIEQIFRFTYTDRLSKYDNYTDELKAIHEDSVIRIDNILSGNDNPDADKNKDER
ncbi:hypothetical protein OAO18_04075 [Francisellaceae bacterium]|nr:hypothetical protein [Francisellaceae bacterium]